MSAHAKCTSIHGVDRKQFGGGNPGQMPPIFLTVGRFVEKKAPHLTLVALAEVARQCAEARLRMIGDGAMLGVRQDLVHALGIENAATFLGALSHAIIQSEMRRARAFARHSIEASNEDSEGMPVAILEACATGIPVISTRHAGVPDAVIEGETGLSVDEKDVQGMAQHMMRLAKPPHLADRLGQSTQTRIHVQFSIEQSTGRLWVPIEDCIKNGYAAH